MQLIDADVLLEYVQKRHKENYLYYNMSEYYEGLCDAYYAVLDFILKQQTIEERKHGHWVQVSDWDKNGQAHFDCSVCGAGDVHADDVVVPYCWHCGAVMDEVTK